MQRWGLYSIPTIGLDPNGLEVIGLTCEEQNLKNMRDQVACINDCAKKTLKLIQGGWSLDEAKKFDNGCNADCRKKHPDLDCDDTVCFDPGPCAILALKLAAWDLACSKLPIFQGFVCSGLNPYKDAYADCLMNNGIR